MENFFGSSLWVVLGLTVVLLGFAAFMTGQALAATWRPVWLAYPYAVLLGLADRFLHFALFEGKLLTLSGFLIDTAILLSIALFAYRITRVRKMVEQYPWIYEKTSPWSYREYRREAGELG